MDSQQPINETPSAVTDSKKKAVAEYNMNSAMRYAESCRKSQLENEIADLNDSLRDKMDHGSKAHLMSDEGLAEQKALRAKLFYYKSNSDLKLSASYTLASLNPNNQHDVETFVNCLKPSTSESWYGKAYKDGRQASVEQGQKTLLEKQVADKLSQHLKNGYYQKTHASHVLGVLETSQKANDIPVDIDQMHKWTVEASEGQLARASKRVRVMAKMFTRTISNMVDSLPLKEEQRQQLLPNNDTIVRFFVGLKDAMDPRNKLSSTGRRADDQLTH